ncbi:hypothetical protein KI387_031880, partial [Taxus chinensis]
MGPYPGMVLLLLATFLVGNGVSIPTTVEGPFMPVTRRFDPSLRKRSDDLPMHHPRLTKKVPSIFPEQISLALSTPHSIWVSWITGDAQIGPKVTPLDPSSVGSEVQYGTHSGNLTFVQRGNSSVYNQIYPFERLLNYTSGIIHHVRLQGLSSNTKYYYKCGDSSLLAMSEENSFVTPPFPSPHSYPRRIAIIGDLGLTSNSSTTIDHLNQNDPSLILMVGDMTYANQYITTGTMGASCFSCAFPDAPIRETYQPRWDGWGREMAQPAEKISLVAAPCNHHEGCELVKDVTNEAYHIGSCF